MATWGGAGAAGVWRLAIAALLLLGVRKLAELGYEYTAGAPGDLFPRSVLRTVEQAVTFPAGERYAVIALTSVFFGPRLTFVILLGWGVLAAGYLLAGQIARSARSAWPEAMRPRPVRPRPTKPMGSPPTAATASWRAGSAPWSMGGCRRCRRCWRACS